jgi:hypothetical protein
VTALACKSEASERAHAPVHGRAPSTIDSNAVARPDRRERPQELLAHDLGDARPIAHVEIAGERHLAPVGSREANRFSDEEYEQRAGGQEAEHAR